MGFSLNIDGSCGQYTINAINSADRIQLYNSLKQARINYFHKIVEKDPTQQTHLNGWLNRVNKFKTKTQENQINVNCL